MGAPENTVGLSGTRTLAAWEPDGKVASGFDVREVVVGRDDAQCRDQVMSAPGASSCHWRWLISSAPSVPPIG